ncbi:type III secretion system stator protein SctL [Paraburkholderia humisilvae]|uniref:Flagellar assembly protein FliH n=1 Tax=Paraburkholderia humisilvae TaxID=627669 RepID=A0A6J5EG30_9BURK|nr:type III secretion system stator protein SctL [Paraburkholderia humisilvae]CAB3764331.1 hypothetical protein LMG29542_04864 [Paraburkholderia humisilvae]
MAIWLRHPRLADTDGQDGTLGARVGAAADIVRAEEFAALVDVDQCYQQLEAHRETLLDAARAEAARVIASGKTQARALLEEARRLHAEAAERGYRAGTERALAEWFERLAQAESAHAEVQERMRARLAGVVASAVEQIVKVEKRELLFERALSDIDRIADGAAYVRVTVHPDDLAGAQLTFSRLGARWRELGQAFPLYVNADPGLQPGSCICESDFGTIDASLDTQLRAMRDAVTRALKRAGKVAASHENPHDRAAPEEDGESIVDQSVTPDE